MFENKVARFLHWTVINGALTYLLYLGMFCGTEWAMNMIYFYVPFKFIVTLFCVGGPAESKKKLEERGRSVPAWMSATIDVGWVVALVASGFFFLASLYTVTSIFQASLFHKKEPELEQNQG